MIKKILCSLIIGFGLLSFSSAGYVRQVGYFQSSPYQENYDLNVNLKGNLFTDLGGTTKNVLYLSDTSNNKAFFFFTNDGKPYLFNYQYVCAPLAPSICTTLQSQGIPVGYYLCDSLNSSSEGLPGNCEYYDVGDNIDEFYKNFFSKINRQDYYYFDVVNYQGGNGNVRAVGSTVCFSSSSYGKSLCFGQEKHSQQSSGSPVPVGVIDIFSFENSITFDTLNSSYLGQSPGVFGGGNSVPDYEFNEDDDFTNGQIIQGYNAMGLTDDFCYGGFALDNIFEAGTVPQQFTGYKWGGGAFIFDIWDIYSGAYNNDYISFLRSFYISYENDNYSDFYGKTKALYGFINQWFSVSSKGLGFIESTAPTFTLVDVWQYCDLRFNKNPDSIYTGDRRNPKFRYYTSGQVNLGGYFNFSGNNNYFSGNLSGFNTPKDFFASLNSIFQGGLNNLENREPVLPTYIIVFFLAIIFIRIISH